jgi:hypothetical protein
MSASNKRDAEDKIANTLQTKINKEIKSTLLDVAHRGKTETTQLRTFDPQRRPSIENGSPFKADDGQVARHSSRY